MPVHFHRWEGIPGRHRSSMTPGDFTRSASSRSVIPPRERMEVSQTKNTQEGENEIICAGKTVFLFYLWRRDMFMARHHGREGQRNTSIRHTERERESQEREAKGQEDQVPSIPWRISFSRSLFLCDDRYCRYRTRMKEKDEPESARKHAMARLSKPRAFSFKQFICYFRNFTRLRHSSTPAGVCPVRSESFNGE